MEPSRILLVAHKTALGEPLREVVRTRMARGPTRFVFLVPAAPPSESLTWEEAEVWAAAEARMCDAVDALRGIGAFVEGRIGHHDAYDAVLDELREATYDEVVVSTLPPGLSAWLGIDLPNRLRTTTGAKVTHVVFDPDDPAPPRTHVDWDRPVGRY